MSAKAQEIVNSNDTLRSGVSWIKGLVGSAVDSVLDLKRETQVRRLLLCLFFSLCFVLYVVVWLVHVK